MKIPILADFSKKVATDYGALVEGGDDDTVPMRALYIISPAGKLRHITANDLPVGRNVDETLRLIKAFQFVDEHGEVCPANWQPGDPTIDVCMPLLVHCYTFPHLPFDRENPGIEMN
jgi:alkyl hydroperoxide reductase subunit AhpC